MQWTCPGCQSLRAFELWDRPSTRSKQTSSFSSHHQTSTPSIVSRHSGQASTCWLRALRKNPGRRGRQAQRNHLCFTEHQVHTCDGYHTVIDQGRGLWQGQLRNENEVGLEKKGVHHSGEDEHSYLWERGIHDFDTMRFMFADTPKRMWAHRFNRSWSPCKAGAGAHAWIEFEGGATCGYLCCFESDKTGFVRRIDTGGNA